MKVDYVGSDSDNKHYYSVLFDQQSEEPAKFASMILAARQMYDALLEIDSDSRNSEVVWPSTINQIRKAIAAAEGVDWCPSERTQ